MKTLSLKKILIIQIVILFVVVVFGFMLRSDPFEGPRVLHKLFGMLAGAATLTSAISVLRKTQFSINQKAFAWVPFTLVAVAGVSGNMLGKVDNYEMVFNMMLFSGVLALLTSVAVFIMHNKSAKQKNAKKPEVAQAKSEQ